MFKKSIHTKKLSIWNKRQLEKDKDNPFEGTVCKDCNKEGHANKNYYKCMFYKEASADDVGTSSGSKRKQSFGVKNGKKAANKKRKLAKESPSLKTVCSACGEEGHTSSSFRQCRQHIRTKAEVLEENLEPNTRCFTRKIPLQTIVKTEFQEALRLKIVTTSKCLRHILIRAMLFVNYHCLSNSSNSISSHIFNKNFWYSICQLVNNRDITNKTFKQDKKLAEAWCKYKEKVPEAIHKEKMIPGASQCLSEACTELATIYENDIVETFEGRLLAYLRYQLQHMFMNMKRESVNDIATQYCYQFVCRGEPSWPSCASNLEDCQKESITGACQVLKNFLPKKVTLATLTANPTEHIPLLSHILSLYETEHKEHTPFDVRRLPLPRLFGFFPKPSTHFRSITISVNALSPFISAKLPRGYICQLALFCKVLDFSTLRYEDEDLHPNGNNLVMFGNLIRSDGFSIGCLFYKRKANDIATVSNLQLELTDFQLAEIKKEYKPVYIDPGRKAVFTAVEGLDKKKHRVIRCTSKEYYHFTGSTRYVANMNRQKKQNGIGKIESGMPSAKTMNPESYKTYLDYFLTHLKSLFDFYNSETAKEKFFLYQGRQRAPAKMVELLIDGGTKYNRKKRKKKKKKRKSQSKKAQAPKKPQKPVTKLNKWKPDPFKEDKSKIPLIVFGNGMFGKDLVKLKGNRCGVTGILWRALKKRESEGGLIAVTIQEHFTSKTCNSCHNQNLKTADHIRGYSVLECKTCGVLWQRDLNAAKNMMDISLSIWDGKGRPAAYTKQKKKKNQKQQP